MAATISIVDSVCTRSHNIMPAPAFVQRILSSFPIYEYPEQLSASSSSSSSAGRELEYESAPSAPTFWLHGPGITSEKESFDVECLKVQAAAVFAGIETRTKWLESSEGAPGGGWGFKREASQKADERTITSTDITVANLPALHLPNGDLLPAGAIQAWISKQRRSTAASEKEDNQAGYSVEKDASEDAKLKSENTSIQIRTYNHLIDGKLQPALVRHASSFLR